MSRGPLNSLLTVTTRFPPHRIGTGIGTGRGLADGWQTFEPGQGRPRSRRHIQAAGPAGRPREPLAFAIEPPALVEYSNSTGAVLHCRPASGQQLQRSAKKPAGVGASAGPGPGPGDRVTIGWRRLVRMEAGELAELELRPAGAARFVRQDGALVLAPFAAGQFRRELHSAQYRCCLTEAGSGRSLCSRQVQTRAGEFQGRRSRRAPGPLGGAELSNQLFI